MTGVFELKFLNEGSPRGLPYPFPSLVRFPPVKKSKKEITLSFYSGYCSLTLSSLIISADSSSTLLPKSKKWLPKTLLLLLRELKYVKRNTNRCCFLLRHFHKHLSRYHFPAPKFPAWCRNFLETSFSNFTTRSSQPWMGGSISSSSPPLKIRF